MGMNHFTSVPGNVADDIYGVPFLSSMEEDREHADNVNFKMKRDTVTMHAQTVQIVHCDDSPL